MTLSLTAALRESARCVSIIRSGSGWTLIGPWDVRRPRGASTESRCSYSYSRALVAAAEWRAEVVLSLMGRLTVEARFEVECAANDPYAEHTTRALVRAGLRAAARERAAA